ISLILSLTAFALRLTFHDLWQAAILTRAMAASLVQITSRSATGAPASPTRKPAWLKVSAPGGPNYIATRQLMRGLRLHTVGEEAHCPNIGECWEHRAATCMILGDVCTRNCAYCAVAHGTPAPLDVDEPVRLAEAVGRLELEHVVITSVDRDDLPNGGAELFAECIAAIRTRSPGTSVEILIPDFKGSETALRIVVDAKPDILNHNLETIARLYRLARPGGRYPRALELLRRAKQMEPGMLTKSGVICGLGEEWDELLGAMQDLRTQGVDILTLGQYLRPSPGHLPIARYYSPDEFAELKRIGLAMGYRHVESGPRVRRCATTITSSAPIASPGRRSPGASPPPRAWRSCSARRRGARRVRAGRCTSSTRRSGSWAVTASSAGTSRSRRGSASRSGTG